VTPLEPNEPEPSEAPVVAFALVVCLVLFGFFVALALMMSGCAPAKADARTATARDAATHAAAALAVAQKYELARLRALAGREMARCEASDTACRKAAVGTVFDAEAPRIRAINEAVAAQGALQDALVKYDGCEGWREPAPCYAEALGEIYARAPALAALLREVAEGRAAGAAE
jgi:hypothetical protein